MIRVLGNTPKIPKEKDKALEYAIKKALKIAYQEKRVMDSIEDSRYTEEHLRYTVLAAISELNRFGTFPNIKESEYHLAFQFHYRYHKNEKEENQFKPDIVSLKCTKVSKYSWNNPLAIELKVNGDNPDKNHSRIKDKRDRIIKLGSCLESDILKTRIYATKVKDSHTFEIGAVINLISHKPNQKDLERLEIMLERQRQEIKSSQDETHKNILFAWYNTLINKPELFWLNRNQPISLGKK
jgi:hypothetical protein